MKILLFSHESDIDGMGSVILAKIAFDNLDYILSPGIRHLEPEFRKYLEDNKLNEYDKIFITDLSLHNPSLDMVNNSDIKNKILIFDHHEGSIDEGCGKYSFENIYEVDNNGIKTCGTKMFYEYLCNSGYLNKTNILDEFVELTRLEDTWDWKKDNNGIKAHDLSILFNAYNDTEKYINTIYDKLVNNDSFEFTNDELSMIQSKKDEYTNKLNNYMKDALYEKDEYGNNYAILFADYEYRNELTEYIESNGNQNDIDYLVIVALNKGEYGQKSYRAIKDVDVNKIAVSHGGGGHPSAAAVLISKEQREYIKNLETKEALEYLANCNYNEVD